jgi:hypothetical protein
LFEDEKNELVQNRGSPYRASFVNSAKPADNKMSGPLMLQYFKEQSSDLFDYMNKKDKAISLKGKDVQNEVNTLLTVKEEIEDVFKAKDQTSLKIDQLEESMAMFSQAVPKVKVDTSKFTKIQ